MEITRPILTIILHYGSELYTWNCVESLIDYKLLDILIVDNDPSQNIDIPLKYLDRIRLLRTGGIAGFAQANNMGVNFGRKKYHDCILILNNDTFVIGNALQEMRFVLTRNDVGAVGPCMPYADEPTKIWACGGVVKRFRLRVGGIENMHDVKAYDVDYLPGAAIMCKLHVWDLVAGLPEKYFLAYEEAEFALRIKAFNYRIMALPTARILHHVGMSMDIQPMYIYNAIRNRIIFSKYLFGRYFGFLYASIITIREIFKSKIGFSLWLCAIRDEITGEPLNRSSLQVIKNKYIK